LCLATVCENGKTILIAADKMVGFGVIESELDVIKMRQVHESWWVLFSGNDISPVLPIAARIKDALRERAVSLPEIVDTVGSAYRDQRLADAESRFLRNRGWTLYHFIAKGREKLPEDLYQLLDREIATYNFNNVSLLVAGFDRDAIAHVFTIASDGEPNFSDLEGFGAVGSGTYGALYWLVYREWSQRFSLRRALLYASEAKFFGEQASGVGELTDFYIARHGNPLQQLSDSQIGAVERLRRKVAPRWPTTKRLGDLGADIGEMELMPEAAEPHTSMDARYRLQEGKAGRPEPRSAV